MPDQELKEIVEYRGVEGLVAARVLTDDNGTDGYTTGDVFAIAGVAEVSKTVATSVEAHYYDNIPAIVIEGVGAETININTSAIPLDVLAEINGQFYDTTTGTLIEGQPEQRYFALGYKTKKTNGDEVYVWRHKGVFSVPDVTSATEDAGTGANGQQLVYTGISTTHKFTKTGKPCRGINTDVGKGLANVTNYFTTVQTPDTIVAKTSYKLTITQAANTTVTVKRNGHVLATNSDIYAGDELLITVTGGTLTVDGVAFTSGDIHVVTGATAVVSTASA